MTRKAPDIFANKRFDVEHALNLYALSYVQFPAAELYNDEAIGRFQSTIDCCHIYFVGYVPSIDFTGAVQRGDQLVQTFEYLGGTHSLSWPMPPGGTLRDEEGWFVELETGERVFPGMEAALVRLHLECAPIEFDVQYIGQAFGSEGDRHALDRLLKHETLQKISLLGAPVGYRLELILVEVEPNNKLITLLNPFADDSESGGERISAGLDKLFGTSYKEMVSLYEAAMIRYFQPKYNKSFKNSFPSTNLAVLQDCYRKDMAAVIAEFCFDYAPFRMKSDVISPMDYHIASFNLHSDEERKLFFGMNA